MRHRIVTAAIALLATACVETSNTLSSETCADVSLSRMRIADAAAAPLGTPQEFGQALAVYRYPVTAGMRLTATLDVPADKDYQMAFFGTDGQRLSCSDQAGLGVDESMEFVVTDQTEVLVKVWTSTSPSTSTFTLLVRGAVPTAISEQEPNDTIVSSQLISAALTTVTGGVDSVASDPDDYFAYEVSEGDVVTVRARLTSVPDGLVYVALQDTGGNTLVVGGEDLMFPYTETETSASFTYTVPAGMDTLIVWMSGIPGAADYSIDTSID